MHQTSLPRNRRRLAKFYQYAPLAIASGLTLLSALPIRAQTIQTDGATPTQVNGGTACSGTCTVTGGAISGSNLFHSLTRFGVDTGSTVTFSDPGVQNIITRITGNTPSSIDGILAVAGGNANLFLFNPNGVIFGNGASLQLGGSFVVSTASGIQFQEGFYSLTDDSATNSLLSVNVPIGLQVGADAGAITVNGTGNNLFLNPDFSVNRGAFTSNLQVNQQTLALVGSDVTLNGSNLTAPSGRVEIGGVGEGFVSLTPVSGGFSLGYDDADTLGDINLENAASIEVSGPSAGVVQLQGQQVTLSGGSSILADTLSDGAGGLIQINAESLSLTGASNFAPPFVPAMFADLVLMPSSLLADVGAGASGEGSRIDINVDDLSVASGAQISASTFGSGNAGELTVAAEAITVDGGRPAAPSALFSAVASGSTGNGGLLEIATDALYLSNGGQISASTFGFGNAGSLHVDAELIEITGSFGTPGAGGPSSLRSASETPTAGAGGALKIETERLLVADGGQIGTATVSLNAAGDLVVRASGQIELSGGNKFGSSGLFANALFGPGSGGNVTVETNDLIVRDGATISVSNNPSSPNSPIPSGMGPAGNLTIAAQNILLDSGGSLTADTVDGDLANISVSTDTLTLLNDSSITTNATGTATGGNIDINTAALTLFDNSAISANSVFSFGGQVIINTEVLLRSPASIISATSALGTEFNGLVEINTPDLPPNEAQNQEESPTENKQIVAACEQLTENELVVTGRGGLPADPTQVLTGQAIWADVREFSSANALTSTPLETPALEIDSVVPLNEAQGWARNEQGQLVLVAYSTTSNNLALASEHQASLCDRG